MAEPLIAPMAQVELAPGMVLTFEALDPTTGDPVAGVTVSAIGIYAANFGGASSSLLASGNFLFVPGPRA